MFQAFGRLTEETRKEDRGGYMCIRVIIKKWRNPERLNHKK